MRMTAWSVVALLISAPATPAHAGNPAQTSLVAAERAFAALSVKQGIRESFLAYLAPDAVVFRPTATNGPRAGHWPSTSTFRSNQRRPRRRIRNMSQ